MRADNDYMLTDEERRLRKRKRQRRITLGLALIVVLVLGFFGARPASNQIKGWQSRRHAQKAFAFIEQEKWSDARGEATAAYQLRPSEPEALRAVARFLSRTRQPQALEFWDQLTKTTELSRTDLRDEAAIALLASDEVRAARAIDALFDNKHGAPSPGDRLLAAQLAIRRNAPADAHEAIDKVARDPQSTGREKLQAAIVGVAISADHPDWRADAWSRLKAIANGKDAVALDGLVVLAQTLLGADKPPDDFPLSVSELAQALEAHPLARAPHKLLAKDLQIREHGDEREQLIEVATGEWKNSEPADAAALATWLNGKREFQRVLDAFPLEVALKTRELYLQYVDALGGLGRWAEIKQLLDAERFPLDPVVQRMYLARCNAQLGEKTAAENNWQRAVEEARGDIGKLITLAGYAEKNGAIDTARAAYDEAAAESPKLRAAHQGRLRIAQAQRNTDRMHSVLADMLRQWPNDTAVQNDEAYTRLLLLNGGTSTISSSEAQSKRPTSNVQHPTPNDGGTSAVSSATTINEELITINELAERLVHLEPSSLPHRTLLALARLKQNRAADALAVYDKLQIATQALTPSALAVHAAVLRANGHAEDADTETKQIPPDTLLPEEQALLAQ